MAELGQVRIWGDKGTCWLAVYTTAGWYEIGSDPADFERLGAMIGEIADDVKHDIRWYPWECKRCGKQQAHNYPPPEDQVCVTCTQKVAQWQ